MNKSNDVNTTVECLLEGGVVLLPTDTVYGLAALPTKPKAVEGIFDLKSRPKHQTLPIMVASVNDLNRMGLDLNTNAKKLLASSYIPGAVTLILGFENGPLLPWLQGREEVAIRIPNDQWLLEVLEKAGPLLVTSANKHGQPITPVTVDEILAELNGTPDLVVDGGTRNDNSSTIINCRVDPPSVQRNGKISPDELFNILQ